MARADAPKVLEYNWGAGHDIRWELEAFGGGTRLKLWHNIDRRFISMGAAGWPIKFRAGHPKSPEHSGDELDRYRLAVFERQQGLVAAGWPATVQVAGELAASLGR